VAAHRAALTEWTRDRVPMQWAITQMNLGNALQILGERESGTARLEEAVTAYRAALEERTRDRLPLQWAMTTGNQGVALSILTERTGDRSMAERALDQIATAERVMREGGHFHFAGRFADLIAPAQARIAALRP
jgi:hypothetical protein